MADAPRLPRGALDAAPADAGYSAAWQVVTCRDCGSTYQCTPDSDYYARPGETITGPGDGLCFPCLVGPELAEPLPELPPKEDDRG